MISKPLIIPQSILFQPNETLTISVYENDQYRIIGIKDVLGLSLRALCNGPYVFRFLMSDHGKVYFVGNDQPYLRLISEGKEVYWLHDLFARYQELLIQKGHSPHTSITDYTLGHLKTIFDVYEVFPGTKEECQCKDCNPNNIDKLKFGSKNDVS